MTLEEQLRSLDAVPITVPSAMAASAWRHGRRKHRQLVIGGAGVACLVLASSTVAGVALHDRANTNRLEPVLSARPSSVSADASAAKAWAGKYPHGDECVVEAACKDRALDAIDLPDPLAGYPVDRGDTTYLTSDAGGPFAPTRWLLRAVTPDRVLGTSSESPSGVEISVLVARTGAFPTAPDASGEIEGHPVLSRTTARGVPAYVVQEDHDQSELLLTAGGFAINVSGGDAVHHVALRAPQLVAIADAITGIPDGR